MVQPTIMRPARQYLPQQFVGDHQPACGRHRAGFVVNPTSSIAHQENLFLESERFVIEPFAERPTYGGLVVFQAIARPEYACRSGIAHTRTTGQMYSRNKNQLHLWVLPDWPADSVI